MKNVRWSWQTILQLFILIKACQLMFSSFKIKIFKFSIIFYKMIYPPFERIIQRSKIWGKWQLLRRQIEYRKHIHVYEHVSLNIHCSANFFGGLYTSTDVAAVDGERSIRGNLDNDVSSVPPHRHRKTVKTRWRRRGGIKQEIRKCVCTLCEEARRGSERRGKRSIML